MSAAHRIALYFGGTLLALGLLSPALAWAAIWCESAVRTVLY